MAIDDEKPTKPAHEVGQDLSALSIHEIDERVVLLEQEIERLREAKRRKEASHAAASGFFRT